MKTKNTINDQSDASDIRQALDAYAIARLLLKCVGLVLLAIITIPLWPLYWLGVLIWYRPPNVPHRAQVLRYLRLTWTVHPPAPGLSHLARAWITLTIIRKVLLTPFWGFMWLMDELLYGRALDKTPVVAPLFIISAGRSGSTQMGLYLEQDPHLIAPNILQCMFPYVWLWRLAPRTLGRFLTPEKVRAKIRSTMPPELLERHEGDPFKMDTFDGAFYSAHLNHMAFQLGPDVTVEEFGFGKFAPHNRQLWEEDFVKFLDRIGRKTLLYTDPAPDDTTRRFLIKGHFLCAAEILEQHYPDARFLTLIREPVSRLRSAINYMRVNPADPMLGPIPWSWLALALERTESDYCEIEQAWFTRTSGARRCVIQFSEFVKELETAMKKVYKCCCDAEKLPPHIPTRHAPRERRHYSVNRSLAELGIDEAELRSRLASYIAWCQGHDT